MKIILTFIVCVLLSGCTGEQEYSKENEVYEFIFLQIVGNAVDSITINNSTDASYLDGKSFVDLTRKYENLNDFPQDLLEHLVSTSKLSRPINWSPILVSGSLIEVSDVSLEPYEGIYHVSGVSFNAAKNAGVLLIGFRCPALCGAHDTLVYVVKTGKQWQIISVVRLWVS